LKYPGGPEIERLARTGDPHAFDFPIPLKNTDKVEFSFSGLKTALLWQAKKFPADKIPVNDLCASFQRAVTEALMSKVKLAVSMTGIRNVAASGGVSANGALREALGGEVGFRAWLPAKGRCTDNAVMIAMAGANSWRRGVRISEVVPDPSLHEWPVSCGNDA
ncbi:MAG: tRNA (adenosine(37)-N6)-threonylcarbamoyltransferase complex transferase subunit TsaD, partial [Synergistaceae bacterium]|nr:tRNA (adenosine(37)-N6)-threonylcarbamoyltransferase complex transferase subunit TsaD [Synergistaceae bacterium]